MKHQKRRTLLPSVFVVGGVLGFGLWALTSRDTELEAPPPQRVVVKIQSGRAMTSRSEDPAPASTVRGRDHLTSRTTEVHQSYMEPIVRRFHPRPDAEWQGMLVDLNSVPYCEGFCQEALACIDGMCGPCQGDLSCLDGERCILDHCVRAELASCASKADCPKDEVCLLSGLSTTDRRGNIDMRAHCSGERGISEQTDEELAEELFSGGPSVTKRLYQQLQEQVGR